MTQIRRPYLFKDNNVLLFKDYNVLHTPTHAFSFVEIRHLRQTFPMCGIIEIFKEFIFVPTLLKMIPVKIFSGVF